MNFLDRVRATHAVLSGKAISHHPELEGRQHLYSSLRTQTTQEIDSYVGYAEIYNVYVWVRRAVGLIADAIAPLPVQVVDRNNKPLPSHPLSELLAHVNDQQSPSDLWRTYTIHKLLGGESLMEIVDDARKRPVELWARRPDTVSLFTDGSRPNYPRVAKYQYWTDMHDLVDVPPENMIHDKFYNPLNEWRGIGVITAVRAGIVIDLFAQAWAKGFLRDGARPDWALVSKGGLTPDERERLEVQIMEKYSGPGGWHRPIVLEGDSEIQTFSYPPKDLEWLQQRAFARDEVGSCFGVPDEIMGYGRDTYENFDTAYKVFWLLTLVPFIGQRDVVLTSFFTKIRPLLRPGDRVATDLSGIGVLQEDKTPKIEQAAKFWAMGVPFNTLDQQLGLGIGPIPGGDVGYLPTGVQPVVTEKEESQPEIFGYHIETGSVSRNEVRERLGLPPEDDSQDRHLRQLQSVLLVLQLAVNAGLPVESALQLVGLDPALAGSSASPPAPPVLPPPVDSDQQPEEQTPPPIEDEDTETVDEETTKAIAKRATAHQAAQTLQRLRRAVAGRMEGAIDAFFGALADRVVGRIGKHWQAGMEVKELPSLSELIEDDDWLDLETTVKQYYVLLFEASWETWNQSLGVDIAFELTDPAVVETLKTAGSRITGIRATTLDEIRALLQYGAEQGWTINQLERGDETRPGLRAIIEETYRHRARTIARTELGHAQQQCAVARFEQMDVRQVLVLDNGQDDPDEECARLNNSIQTLDWARKNPLAHPNCTRCFAPHYD